jgi:hypothetical protein
MKLLNLTRFFVLFLSLSFLFQGCAEDDSSSTTSFNYVTFETKSKDITVNPGATITNDIKVFTTQVSGSDRTFGITLDATSTMSAQYMTIPATVTVPANSNVGIVSIGVTGVGLSLSTPKTIKLNLVAEDGLYTGSNVTINVRENCPLNTVVLSLILDRWGSEITWDIKNASNAIVASGGPYTDGATNALQPAKNFSFCLPNGTYTYTIYDAPYSDGLYTSATVIGSYTISKNGVVIVNGNGNFGASQSNTFTL